MKEGERMDDGRGGFVETSANLSFVVKTRPHKTLTADLP